VEIRKVAVPPLSVTAPRAVEPSRKITAPVAVEGATEAVKVTAWPGVEVVGEAVSTVRVAETVCGGPTVAVTALEVLGPFLESPL